MQSEVATQKFQIKDHVLAEYYEDVFFPATIQEYIHERNLYRIEWDDNDSRSTWKFEHEVCLRNNCSPLFSLQTDLDDVDPPMGSFQVHSSGAGCVLLFLLVMNVCTKIEFRMQIGIRFDDKEVSGGIQKWWRASRSMSIYKGDSSSKFETMMDSNTLLFDKGEACPVEVWIEPKGRIDTRIFEHNSVVEFGRWSTVRANRFCTLGQDRNAYYFEVELLDYNQDSMVQFGVCTSKFQRRKHEFNTGVGDDEHSWAIDGERNFLWHRSGNSSKTDINSIRWKELDVIGILCVMDQTSEGEVAKIYCTVNGELMNFRTAEIPSGMAFEIKASEIGSEDLQLYPALSAGSLRVRYNFGPVWQSRTLNFMKVLDIYKILPFQLPEKDENSLANTFELGLELFKISPDTEEVEMWKHMKLIKDNDIVPDSLALHKELSIQSLSQAVNLLIVKSQIDAIQHASSMHVFRTEIKEMHEKMKNQQSRDSDEKNLDELIRALIETPLVGMSVISFVLPTERYSEKLFKFMPLVIFAIQWILLVTVGNFSMSKYNRAGGGWCLNSASSESRALMSAVSALIFIRNVQRVFKILEREKDPETTMKIVGDDSDMGTMGPVENCEKTENENEKQHEDSDIMLRGLNALDKYIPNTEGGSRLVVFFLLDSFMEIALSSAVLLVNLYIVFVAAEPLDMVLNCLALEFIADLDNQFKEYMFLTWTEKERLIIAFKKAMTTPLEKGRYGSWDRFCKKYIDDKKGFDMLLIFFLVLGFLFSILFAPLVSLAMIVFGPICKPGELP